MKHLLPALAATTALLLSACGGGADEGDDTHAATHTAAAYADAAPGEANDLPADRLARILAGASLSRDQAARLDQALDGHVLWVVAQPGGDDALMLDVGLTIGEQAARDLPNDVPVLVGGADLRRAAELVDRLGLAGLTRVRLVTR